MLNYSYNQFDKSVILLYVCSPDASWMLFLGDGGTRSWLRNSPSCSSAISVRTFRDKQPGFISGRLTSPDSSRLRATSAKHISYNRERQRVSRTHVQITSSCFSENSRTYHLAAFKHFTAELPDWEVPRQPVTQVNTMKLDPCSGCFNQSLSVWRLFTT